MNFLDLKGKVVIVTGALGNLGSACAERLLELSASLVLIDYKTGRLSNRFPSLVGDPDHLLVDSIQHNATESLNRLVIDVIHKYGKIDALINTIGGFTARAPLHKTDLDIWDRMMDMNLNSARNFLKAVIPTMIQQGAGAIVNLGSRAGLSGNRNASAYSASKSAVHRLTESSSKELINYGIRVNCVIPGVIDTPKNREEMPGVDHTKWVKPAEIADLIVFLISAQSQQISGVLIPIFGKS